MISVKNLLYLLLTLLLILNSGTAVGINFGYITIPLYFSASLIAFLLYSRKITRFNIIITSIFLFLITLNYYVNSDGNPNIYSYLILIINYFSTLLFISSIEVDTFKEKFINLIVFIAVYCLFIYIIAINIDLIPYAFVLGESYNFLGFNLHAIEKMRNSGLFWEPGGYQIFLNLALFMLVDRNKFKNGSNEIFKISILIISIITTFSTSGYLILAIIISYLLIKLTKRRKGYATILSLFIMIPVIGVIVYLILNSDVITNKFSETNYSYLARLNHIESSIKVIKESPWIGFGYHTIERVSLSFKYGLINNSVGFFSTTMNFGIIYVVFYCITILMNYKRYYTVPIIWFMGIFVIINMSQAIFDFPILILFLFTFLNGKNK